MPLAVVILAAGQGKRMNSSLPKVLHPLGGKALLAHVIDAARALAPEQIHVVYGHGGEAVRHAFEGQSISWSLQAEQLGTAHAVQQASTAIQPGHTVLVLYGDVPLIRTSTLQALLDRLQDSAMSLLTVELEEPRGYGRIVREAGVVQRIVEEKDANDTERAIREINTGILATRAEDLNDWLQRIGNDNAQGEYYLTDCIELAVTDGGIVNTVIGTDADEVSGVNDKRQLATLERALQQRHADALFDAGVTLIDPQRIDVRGKLATGRDVSIDINTIFEGTVTLGDGVSIGANCVISNSTLAAGTRVHPNTLIDNATIGEDCTIGPFARIRPDTQLGNDVHVGNFVEIKKSVIADHSKANHLTYIGDSEIGQRVNVGAGTITCNYDGANKHKTVVGDDVFIGSDTSLVAPVTVGAGATIGAGSTITMNVPGRELTLARGRQVTIEGWERPKKRNNNQA